MRWRCANATAEANDITDDAQDQLASTEAAAEAPSRSDANGRVATRVVPASSSGRTAAAITRPPCRGGSSGRRVGWSADGVQAKPIEPPMMPSSMPMKKPPKFEAMNDSTASSTQAIA